MAEVVTRAARLSHGYVTASSAFPGRLVEVVTVVTVFLSVELAALGERERERAKICFLESCDNRDNLNASAFPGPPSCHIRL